MKPSISLTRDGKLIKTSAYYAAMIMLGLVTASSGPALPSLAAQTHSTLDTISIIFTTGALGYLLGSLLGGWLYDRLPGHSLMAGWLVGMATLMALIPTISQLWLLSGVMLLVGLMQGALDVGANTLIVWVHRRKVEPFMNGLHFIFGIGALLAPVLIGQALIRYSDIDWAYRLFALVMLPVALFLWRLPSPPVPAPREEGPANVSNYPLVVLIASFLLLYVGVEVGFSGWIYTYATTFQVGDVTAAAYLNSAFWAALTVGRLLSIPIATRLSPRTILLGDLLGGVVSLTAILLWPYSTLALWAGTLGLGLAIASIFPATLSFAGRRMTITGAVTAWFFVGASTGGMLVPWLIGQLFTALGPQSTMVIIFVDLLLATGVYALVRWYAQRE
ncbi:MAG TPA: MFS transporter [Thermoflexia bacterium]|nr:MFS transporter [Thermoflexia bacterium]